MGLRSATDEDRAAPHCNLDEGSVTLIVPATLSEASYADLADQFELFLRRTKRCVSKPDDEAAN